MLWVFIKSTYLNIWPGTSYKNPQQMSLWINTPNDCVATAGGGQEIELKAKTKHCSGKHEN